MRKIVEYIIVSVENGDFQALISTVNKHIADGWQPQGGVVFADYGSSMSMGQAMIKYGSKD